MRESIEYIEELNTKERNMESMAEAINESIHEMNKVIDWVNHSIIEPREQETKEKDDKKDKPSHFLEYLLFYIIMFATVGSAFELFTFPFPNWEKILTLASVLSSAILIGAIKEMLWKMVRKKTRESEMRKARIDALETALASQSIQQTRATIKYDKLIQYIREKYPDANIDEILYSVEIQAPKRITELKSYKDMCDDIEKEVKEHEKRFTNTIKF